MMVLLALLTIETLMRMIKDYKLEREFKKASKEFDKIIRERLAERENKEEEEEVEIL